MASEDFTDCLFSENDAMVDVQVLDYSSYNIKDDSVDTYDDSTECLIVSDGEHNETFSMDEISPNLGPNALTLITLPDGSQAYVGAHDMTQEELDEEGTLFVQEYSPEEADVDARHHIQLDDGTFATLHVTPKDNEEYQAVTMEDGTTTYISLSDLARSLNASQVVLNQNETLSEEPSEDPHANPEEELDPCTTTATTDTTTTTTNTTTDTDTDTATDDTTNDATATSTIAVTTTTTTTTTTKEKAPKCHQCPVVSCGKLYTTTHHLKVHQRAHTGDRPFRCPEDGCTKAFATGYGCKAHIRTHTGEKPYKCPEANCVKCFKTSGDLQKHIRVHTGERPFVCPMPECGRSFTTSNIRKVHYRTHTGERPYTCTVENCGRAFASATNFKNHMRIHSGEKPYQCSAPGCEKRFTEYSSLYKHNLVHTQQKPYHCTACDRTYRQASTLTMHKRTAHGIVETDDGTEIILGETVFTLADTDGGGKRLKALGSNLLGIRDGNRIMSVHTSDGNSSTQQFLVVADSAQLAAFQELELGCAPFLQDLEDNVDDEDIVSDSIF